MNKDGYTAIAFASVKTLKKLFLQHGIVTRRMVFIANKGRKIEVNDKNYKEFLTTKSIFDNNSLLIDHSIKFCNNRCFKKKVCKARPTKRFDCKPTDAKFTYSKVKHNAIVEIV